MTIEVSLRPHPGGAHAQVTAITVTVLPGPREIHVRYRIVGDLTHVRIPEAPLDPARLWANTCCEVFVGPRHGAPYDEWNFSPNGQTAHFAFAGYRRRCVAAPESTSEVIAVVRTPDALVLDARVAIPAQLGPVLRVAIATVIEAEDGALAYWALAHGRDVPDFHDPASFTLGVDLGSER